MTANNHKMLKTCDVKVDGKTWQEREQRRIQAMKDRAQPPVSCGPSIIAAPARGACVVVPNVSLLPQGRDRWDAVHTGYGGHDAVRQMDVFDRMVAGARKTRKVASLTPGQVAIGRRYRDLVERHDAGGVRCSDLGGMAHGSDQTGAGGQSFMDAYLAEGREIDRLRHRIGTGVAMAVRRIRPSDRGARSNILDRVLVDQVCLAGRSLTFILRSHGWAVKTETLNACREALCGALDRMIGYHG